MTSNIQSTNQTPTDADAVAQATAAASVVAIATANQEALLDEKISRSTAEIEQLAKAYAAKKAGAPDADIGNAINMLKANLNLLNVLLQFMAYANDVLNKTRRENMAMDAETTAKLCEKIRETYATKLEAADKAYHATMTGAWIGLALCGTSIVMAGVGIIGEAAKLATAPGLTPSRGVTALAGLGNMAPAIGTMAGPVGQLASAGPNREAQNTQAMAEAINNMQRLMDQLVATLKDNERSQKDMLLKINESMINILQRLLDAFSGIH